MTDEDRGWLKHMISLFRPGKLSRRTIFSILQMCPHGVEPPTKCEDPECVAAEVLES